jgi:DNA polymerase-3 subunit gamma/tau
MALNCQSADRPVTEPCGVCDSCREIREGSVGSMNVIEIDAATNRGIDEVRNIIATAEGQPTSGTRYRIFILDEAHQVTDAAFNALLKTLEEPPPWVVFMMATTQPEDIPQTIRSRCQHFSFHAVRFDDIVAQLRSISDKEGIKVDDDALALLAEAGDGSMRDALSIMDQAIACCGTTLTAELVRGLVGTVNSEVLERVMDGVHRNSSEDVLRIADKLVVAGHSPAHFARQLVRFLRNATIAKVAGKDSSLLQISSDDRERVARVAEWFSEEDLARFLQIMLRTHGDVSYKAEQRFHLELGMLKMVHAQRLLPLEELLSGVASAPSVSGAGRPAAARPLSPPARSATPTPSFAESRTPRPSPFEADRNRKSREDMSTSPAIGDPIPPRVQSATAVAPIAASADSLAVAVQEAPEPQPEPSSELNIDAIREAVLLEFQDQKTLYSPLEEGEWLIQGAEVVVKTSLSPTLLEFAFGADLKRRAVATVVRVAGRPMKFSLVGGANGTANGSKPARPAVGGTSARAKAAQHPVVRKMIDKFGAEIRTVMDPDRK